MECKYDCKTAHKIVWEQITNKEPTAAECGVLVRASRELLIPFLALISLICSNSVEGLAETTWECKLTTAHCWNHCSWGTFNCSFCGLLCRLMRPSLHALVHHRFMSLLLLGLAPGLGRVLNVFLLTSGYTLQPISAGRQSLSTNFQRSIFTNPNHNPKGKSTNPGFYLWTPS